MLSLNEFIGSAHSGKRTDIKSFVNYLQSYEKIILWGAGNLGRTIGSKLIELGIAVSAYWDIRSKELGELNGIRVVEPFSGGYDPDNSLIVFCIGNGVVGPAMAESLKNNNNVLLAEDIYQGVICQYDIDAEFNGHDCNNGVCNMRTCKRLDSLLLSRAPLEQRVHAIQIPNIAVIVNQKCTLRCKDCGSYMNSYPPADRVNFPLERINEDVDLFLSAVDSVRQITIFGGESFIHPDINAIVKNILKFNNFANLSINTSGVCKISHEMLEGINDERFSISFSDYSDTLSAAQTSIYRNNVNFVDGLGIKYRCVKPLWIKPPTLVNKHHSVDEMEKMTASCRAVTMCSELRNGRFYPCTVCAAIHSLGLERFEIDYVDMNIAGSSLPDLREKIRRCLALSYYQSCGYCGTGAGEENIGSPVVGEQGINPDYVRFQ